jgi:hypothetical protein
MYRNYLNTTHPPEPTNEFITKFIGEQTQESLQSYMREQNIVLNRDGTINVVETLNQLFESLLSDLIKENMKTPRDLI